MADGATAGTERKVTQPGFCGDTFHAITRLLSQFWYNITMSETVIVSIPETLYRQARALAHARRQSTDAVIAEVLAQGLTSDPSATAIPSIEEEAAMTREIAAYQNMHGELFAAHRGKFVAVFGGQLVDHDADETALLRRIDTRYPDEVVLLRRVGPLPERELRVRSPRLEREPG